MVNTVGGSINALRPHITREIMSSFDGDVNGLREALLELIDENLRPLDEQSHDLGVFGKQERISLGAALVAETDRVYGVHQGNVNMAREQLSQAINSLLEE